MKHVRESLTDFYNKKYFDALHYRMFEAEENDEKSKLQDKEKAALDVIKKVNDDFDKFKSAAKGEISQYKNFWEETQQAKELFSENGNVYKMYGSDYVIGVLDLPTKIGADGSVEGGLGAFQEEEEIIEGKPQEEITIEGDNSGMSAPDLGSGDNLAEAEGEEEDLDLDLDKPAEEPSLDEPAEEMPADDIPQETDVPGDENMPGDAMPIEEEPFKEGPPQTYLVVYDMSGGEREEIFRNGSTNAVKAFRDFYENTFKGSMKVIIQEYKMKKAQEKKEAEAKEKERKEKEKSSKLQKFLGKDVNEAIKHMPPIPEEELVFSDSREAGSYVKDNLLRLTGFSELESDPNDEDSFHPKLYRQLKKWYKHNKHNIEDESEDDYWDEFIDWEALRYAR